MDRFIVYDEGQALMEFTSFEAALNFIQDESMAGNDTAEYWISED